MKARQDRLTGTSAIKGTILQAHLLWAQRRLGDVGRLRTHVGSECAAHVDSTTLSTAWVPFRCLIAVDRAIAAAAGGSPDRVFRDLGEHSARMNLGGVYKSFDSSEPHRVFAEMGALHRQFQDFGEWQYAETAAASGRITLTGYSEYSPVYCASALGYFEGALKMMHAPGRISVRETACQCAGDRECLFELSW
jgi:predicted hydrocarbon binding protein